MTRDPAIVLARIIVKTIIETDAKLRPDYVVLVDRKRLLRDTIERVRAMKGGE